MTTSLTQQLAEQFEQLSLENRQHVLDYIRQLLLVQQGVPASKLLRFAGLIPEQDLAEIERAIQQSHEQSETHE